jgi:uncharacterized secreted repeat protein (TIGR03808 family)
MNRRHMLIGSLSAGAALAAPIDPASAAQQGLDAAQFGVRPNATDEQTGVLQHAIDQAALTRSPLFLAPGYYRTGTLRLSAGTQLFGVRGATILALQRGAALLSAHGAGDITLSGLNLDGGGHRLPGDSGLVRFIEVKNIRIGDCSFLTVDGNAVSLARCSGAVSDNIISGAGDNALMCLDSRMTIRGNLIARSGNGGIRVWRSEKSDDGSIVEANSIEATMARGGGDGQNGNAINIFRAAGVIVRNNVIRNAAFTAVRGNAASNIQVIGNNCSDVGEVALYAEFDFEGAVISGNVVDGAAVGVAVTNFNDGGRLAVVQGNLIRNLKAERPQRKDSAGLGIGVEADTAVTGNVIENAPAMGISVGYGKYLRDVTVTGNVVRETGIGIGVSVSSGAGRASITGNTISGARRGAIVGLDWDKPATGDLAKDGAARHSHLTVADNQTR